MLTLRSVVVVLALLTLATTGCVSGDSDVGPGEAWPKNRGGGPAMFVGDGDGPYTGSASLASDVAGDLGATVGGAQDIAYARTLIEQGDVPPADAITVEGLLSEHDLPSTGEPCEDLLCIRPALGVTLAPGSEVPEVWVHLDMLSGLETPFVAPPIDVVVLVDKSRLMQGDMAETNHAVTTLIDRLRPEDRIGVLTFDDSVHTLFEPGAVEDAEDLKARVRGVQASGGMNLMAGLEAAYEVANGMGDSSGRIRRVVVLSCGYPDASSRDASAYRELVEQWSGARIGLTFIGILLGFDYELANTMSQAHGGNYYYTDTLERTETIISDEFDFMMTPLAYDMKLGLELAEGLAIERIYGLPGQEGDAASEVSVNTVFPSKRGGAIVAKLRHTGDGALPSEIATVNLGYRPEPALGWDGTTAQQVELRTNAASPDAQHFDSPGARKAIALVHMAQGMIDALGADDREQAVDALEGLAAHLDAEAEALDDDEGLHREAELVRKLASNL